MTLKHSVIAGLAAASIACGSPTTPIVLEALPLQSGAYSMVVSAFVPHPLISLSPCPSIPPDLAFEFPVTLQLSGLTWLGVIRGSSGLETGRIVLEARPTSSAPSFSGVLSGSVIAILPDGNSRAISFGNEQARVSGTLATSGQSATGTLGGLMAVVWSTVALQLNTCAAGQATLTLTRVQ